MTDCECKTLFMQWKDEQSPTVIFDAPFNKSYNDLLTDGQQWLMYSGRAIQLVVLVNIKEDHESIRNRQTQKHRL